MPKFLTARIVPRLTDKQILSSSMRSMVLGDEELKTASKNALQKEGASPK
jgi:hypothetical protein